METRSTTPFPANRFDGRAQHSLDPDARAGYRSGKNLRRKDVFLGYDAHIITQVPDLKDLKDVKNRTNGADREESVVPHLALALTTAPAGSSKAAAGLLAVDAMLAAGYPLRTLLADRGYTYLKADSWALQLRARGVESVHDLHPNQRGVHPGPLKHTLWIDGTIFTDALPVHLRNLPGFPLGLPGPEVARRRELYDQRAAYAYTPQGQPDPRTGSQRFRGPALTGRLRDPNTPDSMRLGHSRPTTQCVKGQPCGCHGTVVLGVEDHARERQREPWGTTKQASSYGRRSGIESLNAELRSNRGMRLRRGFIRVFGTAKTHFLLAVALAGLNVRLLRDWHIGRSEPDPWLSVIGDTSDPDWATVHKGRKRKPRKLALHERLAHPEIPRRVAPTLRGTAEHRRQYALINQAEDQPD